MKRAAFSGISLDDGIGVASCASRVGHGSIFGVRLPLAGFEKNTVRTPTAPSVSTNIVAGNFIVVVDDEQDILFSTDPLLTKQGCHVVCARSGHEAVMQLAEHLRTPDLIITDYRLASDETGVDVIRKIRAAQDAHIPGLIVTGASSEHDLAEATGSGYPVMFKPLTEKQLLAKIAETLASMDDQIAICPAARESVPNARGQIVRANAS